MRSIADFKRACVPGSPFWFTSNWYEGMRKCTRANTAGAYFSIKKGDEEKESFIDWPKKAEVQFVHGGILVNSSTSVVLFYYPGEPTEEEKTKIRDHVMEVYRQKNGV